MKKLILALMALLLAAPCMAIEQADMAYLKGLDDGYTLGRASIQGQTNTSQEALYNGMVADLNAWMDQIGYEGGRWGNLPIINHTLPPIFNGGISMQQPYIEATGKASGVEHKIDGKAGGQSYTTNDANLLPDNVRYNHTSRTYSDLGGQWLGGI